MPGWSSRAAASASRDARSGAGRAGRDDLDGHVDGRAARRGGVDGAEAARAEPRAEPVAAEDGRGGGRRPRAGGVHGPGAPPWRPSEPGFGGGARDPCRALVTFATSCRRPRSAILDDPTCPSSTRTTSPADRAPRPRRASGGDVAADTQTIRVRQAVAAIGLIVVVLLLVFVVKGCRDSAEENALKDYNREVSTIANESSQAGRRGVLPRCSARAAASRRRTCRPRSRASACRPSTQLKQAEGLSVPGEMRGAHQSLLHRARVAPRRARLHRPADPHRARRLRRRGRRGDPADRRPDGGLPRLRRRLRDARRPVIKAALDAERDRRPGRSRRSPFLPTLEWLQPDVVAEQLGQQLSAGAGRDSNEPTGPGLHGTNIDSVAYGDTTLQPGHAQPADLRGGLHLRGQVHQRRRQRRVRRQGDGPHRGRQRQAGHARPTRSTRSRRRPARPPTSRSRTRRRSAPRSRSP